MIRRILERIFRRDRAARLIKAKIADARRRHVTTRALIAQLTALRHAQLRGQG